MRNYLMGLILAVGAVLAVSPAILAQTVPPSGAAAKATPDLSGIWSRPGFHAELTNPDGSPLIPPMQPWAAAISSARSRAREGGDSNTWAIDPRLACLPSGLPRSYLERSTFELSQVPGRLIQIFEAARTARIIYTDERKQAEGYPASFLGHSVGRWDGDTLVVDTVGFNDVTWLDRGGHPHTEDLRLVERLRRVKQDTLEVDILIDDPKAYTKPWGGKVAFELRPDWELLENFICMEHFDQDHLPVIRRLAEEFSKP